MFVHHVFFWLKESLTNEETVQFEKAALSLLSIDHVTSGDVGKPATTDRPVIERGYSYSLLLVFENLATHDAYRIHPVHEAFVKNCSALWEKVLVYDSESVQ